MPSRKLSVQTPLVVFQQFILSNLQNDAINILWSRTGLYPRLEFRCPKIGELGTEGTELCVLVRRFWAVEKCPPPVPGRGECGWIGGRSASKPEFDGLFPKIWPTSRLGKHKKENVSKDLSYRKGIFVFVKPSFLQHYYFRCQKHLFLEDC